MTFPGAPAGSITINPFDPAATEIAVFKSVDAATAAIPDGHTHAILLDADYTSDTGATGFVSFVQKAPNGWNVVATGEYTQAHGLGAGVLLAKSW